MRSLASPRTGRYGTGYASSTPTTLFNWPGSSAMLQPLGLATETSALLSRSASCLTLVTASSLWQLSTLDWALR
jgi:hypothetical protein